MGSVDPDSKVLCTGREFRLAGLDEPLLPETLMMDMKKGESAIGKDSRVAKNHILLGQERSVGVLNSRNGLEGFTPQIVKPLKLSALWG